MFNAPSIINNEIITRYESAQRGEQNSSAYTYIPASLQNQMYNNNNNYDLNNIGRNDIFS